MKHQFKQGICFILCAILASLTAISCSQGSPASSDSPSPSSNASADMPVDPMMKYDPVLTINIAMSEGNFEFPEGEDYQHNDMYDLFEDTMGIHFNNIIQAPANAMKEKMQMAIATNDIPDMASVDATMLRTLINNDMIEDMTDIYNTWASDNLKEVTGQSDNALFAPTLKDGR